MKLQRFDVSETPQLTVICHGDLDIIGGREGEIAIKAYGQEEDLQVEREDEHLTVTSHVRCRIGCPRATHVTVQATHGKTRVRHIYGPMTIENAFSDLALKDVGPTIVTNASGDVRVRAVHGELRLDQVAGDLSVRYAHGPVVCASVGGDLSAVGLEAGLDATTAGDASLKTDLKPGRDFRVTASGNVSVRFPANASARFHVTAHGKTNHQVDWVELEERDGSLSARVGEGEANVEITSNGQVFLQSKGDAEAFDASFAVEDAELELGLETMAEELERNIEAHMARLNAQLEDKLSRIDYEAIQRKAERAAQKARRRAEQAAERARLKAERAQRRWKRMGPAQPARTKFGAPPPAPPREPVSDAERMTVLRMVQEGKISAEDAAKLLEAMGG